MPIRHLCFLITSQPLRLHRSGSHTWLHPDYILPPASLIWLFTGQEAISTGWKNMSQLIGKHGLEQKQAMEASLTPRHPSIVSWKTDIWDYPSVRYGLSCYCFSKPVSLKNYGLLCSYSSSSDSFNPCLSEKGECRLSWKIFKKKKAAKYLGQRNPARLWVVTENLANSSVAQMLLCILLHTPWSDGMQSASLSPVVLVSHMLDSESEDPAATMREQMSRPSLSQVVTIINVWSNLSKWMSKS